MDTSEGQTLRGSNGRQLAGWATSAAAVAAIITVSVVAALNRSSPSEGDGVSPVSIEPYAQIAALATGGKNASSATVGAAVKPDAKSGLSELTLTAQAAKRLGIETLPVRNITVAGNPRPVVPFSAVVYDPDGVAWAYTSTGPLAFVRQRLTVDRVAGGVAVLSGGPKVGTEVVAVGAAELFGAEIDFGKG